MRAVTLSILAACAVASMLSAQSPMPVIIQAATPGVAPARVPVASENSASLQEALKILRDTKKANEETLRKQAATLEQLEELEKTADQIRIFTGRN